MLQLPGWECPFDLRLKVAEDHDLLVVVAVVVGVIDIGPLSVVVARLHLTSEEAAGEEQRLPAVV